MKWSKLKRITEAFLADSVKNRIRYHITQYGPGDSYTMARGWITFDGKEIANFSTVEWMMQYEDLAGQIRDINQCTDCTNPDQKTGYYLAYDQAEEVLQRKGVFSRDQFYDSLEEYAQLPIEAALNSHNKIIQGLTLLDRRFGMRRLKAIKLPESTIEFVKTCHRIRSEAEEIEEPDEIR